MLKRRTFLKLISIGLINPLYLFKISESPEESFIRRLNNEETIRDEIFSFTRTLTFPLNKSFDVQSCYFNFQGVPVAIEIKDIELFKGKFQNNYVVRSNSYEPHNPYLKAGSTAEGNREGSSTRGRRYNSVRADMRDCYKSSGALD